MRCILALIAAVAIGAGTPAQLVVRIGDETRAYSTGDLLHRTGVATIIVPFDVSYRREMRYRAIPLEALLVAFPNRRFEVLEVAASDGFVAEIPMRLFGKEDDSIPWIAIDDPSQPWPNLPNKNYNAGPFYLVWEHPERSKIMSEQWVSSVGKLTGTDSAVRRWPQLNVGTSASGDVRRGMNLFITQCLPCHRFDGAGSSTIGPDLRRPMSATAYMTDRGLRALIRDPKSVRSWPKMSMPGFPPSLLTDDALNAIVLYLRQLAPHSVSNEPRR